MKKAKPLVKKARLSAGEKRVAAVMGALGDLTWRDLPQCRIIVLAGELLFEWDKYVNKEPPYDKPLSSIGKVVVRFNIPKCDKGSD